MCVRYTLHKPDDALAAIAAALARKLTLSPPALSESNGLPDWATRRFNITLTHVVPVVSAGADGPELHGMVWGLVPAYARSQATTPSCSSAKTTTMLHNAKAETAATLSAFKQSVAKRRCLVPANGFYEWQTFGKLKLPHLFTLRDEEPFAFAGIWEPGEEEAEVEQEGTERKEGRAGSMPGSFAILTTTPNDLVAPIHNRMPVILTADAMRRWLGSDPLPEEEYRSLTAPLPADRMQARPVSRYVSNSRNDGPQCHAAPDAPSPELALG